MLRLEENRADQAVPPFFQTAFHETVDGGSHGVMRSDFTVQLWASCSHDCRVGRFLSAAGSPTTPARNQCAYHRHCECNVRCGHVCVLPSASSFTLTATLETPANPELRPAVL